MTNATDATLTSSEGAPIASTAGPRARAIGCTDALGRRRELGVHLTDEGLVCFRTPPGEAAQLDWFEVDQLRRQLAELRPHMPYDTVAGSAPGGWR